jgi:hypothetical protein
MLIRLLLRDSNELWWVRSGPFALPGRARSRSDVQTRRSDRHRHALRVSDNLRGAASARAADGRAGSQEPEPLEPTQTSHQSKLLAGQGRHCLRLSQIFMNKKIKKR